MSKEAGKVELRYYEVLKGEYLFTQQGNAWEMPYVIRDDRSHFHNLMEIGACRYGSGVMALGQERHPFTEGSITVIPANYPHSTSSDEGTENYWEYIFVDPEKVLTGMYPDDDFFRKQMEERLNKRAYLCNATESPELANVVYAILRETRNKRDAMARETLWALTMLLIVQLARDSAEEGISGDRVLHQRTGFDQIRPALDYIRENYALSMKINEIAQVCHMSESHFRRLFEENVNMTPVEYLNRVRIWRACDLIRKTGSSMEEVAAKVGFSTPSTFNRNFKRMTGFSPYQWKKQLDTDEYAPEDADVRLEQPRLP